MKVLKCEMCGSGNFIKQEGFYMCQNCGTKYTLEEAKKMLVEGTVKIDNSEEINKLFQAARNAKEAGNSEIALKHYEKLSALVPDNWEAVFYTTILKTEKITNGQINSSAISIAACLQKVFSLVKQNIKTEQEQVKIVTEICSTCTIRAILLFESSKSFRKNLTKGTSLLSLTGISGIVMGTKHNYNVIQEDVIRCANIAAISATCGDCIEKTFGLQNENFKKQALNAWKQVLKFHVDYKETHKQPLLTEESVKRFNNTIKKYDPNFQSVPSSSGGCYVATCVYGSYDCPQVWTLRRYRDTILHSTWHGRAFIRTYYAISPTLVKWFGKTKWFKKMWKGKLDKMVKKLQDNGIESTPYCDK